MTAPAAWQMLGGARNPRRPAAQALRVAES